MSTITTQHKAFGNVTISPDEPRTVVVTASTAAVDREGEVLIPMGCNSREWKKNPIITLQHSYYNLPVGKGTGFKQDDEAVTIKFQFAERPKDHPEGEEWVPDTLFSLYQQGVMGGVSVGFIPVEGRIPNTRDAEKFGPDCRYIHSKWRLLELAVVTLGCNQDAVTLAVSKGFVSQATADKLFSAEKGQKQAENVETTPEMANCTECGESFPVAEMSADGDDYACKTCGEKADGDDTDDDSEEKDASGAPIKQKIAPHVVIQTLRDDSPEPIHAKHVVHVLDPDDDGSSGSLNVAAMIDDAMDVAVKRARGVIYID